MPDGNPYARMAALMHDEAGQTSTARSAILRLGTVVQQKPLEVTTAGVRLPVEALRINERLAKGAKWKTKLTAPVDVLDDPARLPAGAFTRVKDVMGSTVYNDEVSIDQAEQEQLEIDLETGDTVLLLTEDDQVFYILMKVVDAV